MTKSTKPETKKEIATVNAVAETESYEKFVDEAVQLSKAYEKATLIWYWQMGALFSRFIASAKANQLGGRTVDHFVKDIRANGFEADIGESTLYAAKQIHDRYAFEAIGKLVEGGVCVGHLKLLMPLTQEQRDTIERKMVDAEGKVISVRALETMISDVKRLTAQTETSAKIETASKPAEKQKGKAEAGDSKPDYAAPAANGKDAKETPAAKTPEKGDHRAAPTIREFTKPPRQALEAFGKKATACTAAIGDAFIACAEGIKIGFDGERARDNFIAAVDTAYTDATTLYDALGKLIEQIKETRDDAKSTVDEKKPKPFKPKKKR